jgi:hypothetical protein
MYRYMNVAMRPRSCTIFSSNQGDRMTQTNTEQMYMHIHTGEVDSYDGWYYEHNPNKYTKVEVNAVDRNEVVPVFWDTNTETWKETE